MNEVTNNYTSTDVMSADITKLVEAQMKLTDEFSKIKKDSQGQFKYTSMDYLLPKIKPIMKKHGITFMQAPIGNDGMIGVKTIWMHKSGQYIISNVSVPIDTNTRVSSYQSAGQAITIYNNSSSNITITQGASVTMYLAGTSTTGNRTLSEKGVCTVLCVSGNTFTISGAGMS